MSLFDFDRRAAVVVGLAVVVAAFLIGYLVVPTLLAQQQPQDVELLEANIVPTSVKAGQPSSLIVRIANNLDENINVKVLLVIEGDIEKYVSITGFNVEKISNGVWQWDFGIMPPSSEVKYVAKLAFNIPSGIAEIKYRVHVDFVANGSSFDSRDFIIKVSS